MKTFLCTLGLIVFCMTPLMAQETTQPQNEQVTSAQSANFESAMKLYKQKRYKDAIAEFQRIVDVDPKNAAAWYMLGYAHYVLDHHSDALAAFAKAFEADPAFDPRPYFRR